MADARFEDGADRPLRLMALDDGDLQVISGLVQDAVFQGAEMTWDRARRRFAILLNRFRWEDVPAAERRGGDFERVRALLVVENVMGVASQGVGPGEDAVLSTLAIGWDAGEDAAGHVTITLAGDGAVRLEVEALEVLLRDVTRPHRAVSGKRPEHDLSDP